MTESLVVVRCSVHSLSNLHQHASLVRKIEAVEKLLLPTDGCEEDFATYLDPLDVALSDNRELQAKIARIEAEHKGKIETKNKQLDEYNTRLQIKQNSQDKGSQRRSNHESSKSSLLKRKELILCQRKG